ncbi:hypothetical protein IFR05_017138, partial [Cadophora sp. M221]
MAGGTIILEWIRVGLAAAMLVYFLFAPLKKVETRDRSIMPFFGIFAFFCLISLVDLVVSLLPSFTSGDDLPRAVTLYSFGTTILFDDSCNFNKQPAWHAYVGSWVLMAAFETLSLVQHVLLLLPSAPVTPKLVFGMVAAGLKALMSLGLIFLFVWVARDRKGGYTALPGDDSEQALPTSNGARSTSNVAVSSNNNDDDEGNDSDDEYIDGDETYIVTAAAAKAGKKEEHLRKLVEDEIAEAGSTWKWLKKFTIFWPCIWPRKERGLQAKTVFVILLVLYETFIDLVQPRLWGALVESVVEGKQQQSMAVVSHPLIILVIAWSSRRFSESVRPFLWTDVKLHRGLAKDNGIFEHLLKLDGSYYEGTDASDILESVKLGGKITDALDFLAFDVVPRLIKIFCVGAVTTRYGQRVTLVVLYVMLLYSLNTKRSIKATLPRQDIINTSKQQLVRHFNDVIRGWKTIAQNNQADTERESYAIESSALKQRNHTL